MTDDEKQKAAVREQTTKIMRGAAAMLGGREALAAYLGVEPCQVAEWLAGLSDAPYHLVNKAVDAIVDAVREPAPLQKSRPKV